MFQHLKTWFVETRAREIAERLNVAPPPPCNARLGPIICKSTGLSCPHPHLSPAGGPFACLSLMSK